MADIKIFGTLKSQTVEGAIAYSKEIVGGFMTLTQQERDSLNDVLKQDKMTIFCTTDNSYYRLENNTWVKVLEVTPPDVVLVSSTGTSGTLTNSQLAILRSNEDAKIKFEEEVYRLNDDKMDKGYLTYTHNSYISNVQWQKVITITISTMAWVLNSIKVASKEYVDAKLDKVTTTTSSNQAYVKNMDGSQGMIPIVQGVSGDSIPRRLADGRLQAKAGTSNDDVVNKKQLDDAIASAITTALNTAV